MRVCGALRYPATGSGATRSESRGADFAHETSGSTQVIQRAGTRVGIALATWPALSLRVSDTCSTAGLRLRSARQSA